MPTTCFGGTRSSAAAASVARKHAVPDAVSQLKVKTAAYGASLGVTGGMRMIALCRPGTNSPIITAGLLYCEAGSIACVCASIAFFTDGAPTTKTKMTSRRYGDHAIMICAGVCFAVAAAIG